MVKHVAVLGSTGSIGQNALRVIEALGPEYQVVALSAHKNVELLADQASRFRPRLVAVTDANHAGKLRQLLRDSGTEVLAGPDSLTTIAKIEEVDIVLSAVVGVAGLGAAFAAVHCGKRLAVANKEPLVIAGELLTAAAKKSGASILPVDSEHSAVFQAMHCGCANEVSKIILTSSGGPFRGATTADLQNVTLEQALAHPVWEMGPKITIDSATMMNKALEIIEARWLFDIPFNRIEVLVHPESIVHSLVEFVDGSMAAQLGEPDMCLPIQYALTYPKRVAGISRHLRLEEIGQLTFEKPNMEAFRALPLAYEVGRVGGTAAAVFNGANEAAVEEFLEGSIRFVEIMELVEQCLNRHQARRTADLDELLEADSWARREIRSNLKRKARHRTPNTFFDPARDGELRTQHLV
jgi:1-deoxy-D-xylulose-5-phosphate reductoisomerase